MEALPIVSLTNILSVGIVLILMVLLWRRNREQPNASVRALLWFLSAVGLASAVAVLPGLVIKDIFAMKLVVAAIDFVVFCILVAYSHFLFGLLSPARRFFQIGIPAFILLLGIGVVLWEIIDYVPVEPVFSSIAGIPTVSYDWNLPPGSQILTGVLGAVLFALGGLVFFREALRTKETQLRKRSLFLGGGFAMAALAVALTYLREYVPGLEDLAVLSPLTVFLSLFLLYRGALIPAQRRSDA
ncbi:MAG: hypothetical protein Q8P12_02330 [bacterium]|nr:hypothetical protein [bacterium]